jgi:hypothetical protein
VVAVVVVALELAVSELVVLVSPGYVPADEDSPGYVPAEELPEPSQAQAAPAPVSASADAMAIAAIGRLTFFIHYLLVVGVVTVNVCVAKAGRDGRTTSAIRRLPRRVRGTSRCRLAVGWRAEVRYARTPTRWPAIVMVTRPRQTRSLAAHVTRSRSRRGRLVDHLALQRSADWAARSRTSAA